MRTVPTVNAHSLTPAHIRGQSGFFFLVHSVFDLAAVLLLSFFLSTFALAFLFLNTERRKRRSLGDDFCFALSLAYHL